MNRKTSFQNHLLSTTINAYVIGTVRCGTQAAAIIPVLLDD